MNKLVFVAIVGFLAIQTVESRNHQRSNQNAVQQGEVEQTLSKKAQEFIKNTDEVLAGNLPDTKQIADKIQDAGQSVVEYLKTFNDLVKKTLKDHEGEIDTNLKQFSDNLKSVRETFETKVLGADGQKNVQEIRNAFNKGLKDAAKHIGEIGDNWKPEAEKLKNDIAAGGKSFLENLEKVTKDFKENVDKLKSKN
ncbi:unnamed protein product [Phyllotreta striolata]|uniref:Apolipophorin-III n=1 Tax=Phyllotreta striolata TaxID=444603 RepID=A0A9N9XP29_PHYSR|nr:unnamed protein product [Phyllotreta striolata]